MREDIERAIRMLVNVPDLKNRNLLMPGDGRYQAKDLKPYLGYDQFAGWLVIVEWAWLLTLAQERIMPLEDAEYLNEDLLAELLYEVTTTEQDRIEADTKHDIVALTNKMKEILPKPLHQWLHYCATSYDIICTAYALQYRICFDFVIWPKMQAVDVLWRRAVSDNANVLQAGRTHLQTALPTTVGCWLGQLHSRFVRDCLKAKETSALVEGKFSGAIGTFASQVALVGDAHLEGAVLEMLNLKVSPFSTQITQPESMQRAYHELMLVSGVLGNLGEDGRILQSSQYKELVSASSTSSAMSHKTANPIAAEQLMGMHRTVVSEYMLIAMNMVSDLQRDLTGSSCMRRYSSIVVYLYQQLCTAERWFKNLKVNEENCRKNFEVESKLLTAEVLHLSLGRAGLENPHHFVNAEIVPLVIGSDLSLCQAMDEYVCREGASPSVIFSWNQISAEIKELLSNSSRYLGLSVELAKSETIIAL